MTTPRECPECGAEVPPDSPQDLCPRCMIKLGFDTGDIPPDRSSAAPTTGLPSGSAERPVPDIEELRALFPELEIVEAIGHGGMGLVYLARQTRLDRLVALKILRPDVAVDPTFAERFTREARTMARLSHPAIIGLHDFGQRDGTYYFLMEYVDGTNLRQIVKESQLKPSEALAIVPVICDALQYAHDEGVVHRDIKPENILMSSKGQVKIADFGLAKLVQANTDDLTLTGTHQVMGTPQYMAPEQIERPSQVDHRADIYSLGVVIYELLTGELPLGRFSPPSKKVQVDVRLDEVVLRALEKEPEQRYQHASEVKTNVRRFTDTMSSEAENVSNFRNGWWTDLRIPAFGLMAAALVSALTAVMQMAAAPRHGEFFLLSLWHAFIAGLVGYGALNMLKRRNLRWAQLAAGICLIPLHTGVFVGGLFAVWALWLLHKRGQWRSFERYGDDQYVISALDRAESFVDGQLERTPDRVRSGVAWLQPLLDRVKPWVVWATERLRALFSTAGGIAQRPGTWPWRRLCLALALVLAWLLLVAGAGFWFERTIITKSAPSSTYLYDNTAQDVRFTSEGLQDVRFSVFAEGITNDTLGKDPPLSDYTRKLLSFKFRTELPAPKPGESVPASASSQLLVDLDRGEPVALLQTQAGNRLSRWHPFDKKDFAECLTQIGIKPDRVPYSAIEKLSDLVDAIHQQRGPSETGSGAQFHSIATMLRRYDEFSIHAIGDLRPRVTIHGWVYVVFAIVVSLIALTGILLVLYVASRPRKASQPTDATLAST